MTWSNIVKKSGKTFFLNNMKDWQSYRKKLFQVIIDKGGSTSDLIQ